MSPEHTNPISETPIIHFSRYPNTIKLEGHKVFEYIPPEVMEGLLDNLFNKFEEAGLKLEDFDAVLVNKEGGLYIYKKFIEKFGEPKITEFIEYHRPKDGFGAIITTPVPEYLHGKKCLNFDDIWDTGGTSGEINKNLSPDSVNIFVVQKTGIENQIMINNSLVAVKIDDVWVGGCGMNLESEGDGLPKGYLREYEGIVVKILKNLKNPQPL